MIGKDVNVRICSSVQGTIQACIKEDTIYVRQDQRAYRDLIESKLNVIERYSEQYKETASSIHKSSGFSWLNNIIFFDEKDLITLPFYFYWCILN